MQPLDYRAIAREAHDKAWKSFFAQSHERHQRLLDIASPEVARILRSQYRFFVRQIKRREELAHSRHA